jgi:hypothetical protein
MHAAVREVVNANDTGLGPLPAEVIQAGPGDEIVFDASLAGRTIALDSAIVIGRAGAEPAGRLPATAQTRTRVPGRRADVRNRRIVIRAVVPRRPSLSG